MDMSKNSMKLKNFDFIPIGFFPFDNKFNVLILFDKKKFSLKRIIEMRVMFVKGYFGAKAGCGVI
jgi:hypothetical protein